MTSEERREKRYIRRKQKRNKSSINDKKFEEVFTFNNLYKAGKKCCNNVRWKGSTIKFETTLLDQIVFIYDKLYTGKRHFKGFHSFSTIEHGKLRNIDALPIYERAAQKCLCENYLVKLLSKSFIYDNAASLPNKGMDFALRRLKKHLGDHYRKYGLEGGIYQFDFKNYFGSIPHHMLKQQLSTKIQDEKLYTLCCDYIDDFKNMKTFDKNSEVPRGLGLGSEISQILALSYVSSIDHYVKDVAGIKGYGRYMDDGYVISNSLDELKKIQTKIKELANNLGLKINPKKDNIIPFKNQGFVFLKMRIMLKHTGKIVMKVCSKSVKSMRRKLKIFKQWLSDKRITFKDIVSSYQSWRAHLKRCTSYQILYNMDLFFKQLFNFTKRGVKNEKTKSPFYNTCSI